MIEPTRTGVPRLTDVRVVLLGAGAINARVAQLLADKLPSVRIVGYITRGERPVRLSAPRIYDSKELAAASADIVVEAASHDALRDWGPACLRNSRTLIVSSVGALGDDDFRRALELEAASHGSKVVLSPGAAAGVEALAAASTVGFTRVTHRIVKPPAALGVAGTVGRKHLFSGTAREAALKYPKNANSVVTTALASAGLDNTRVEIIADSVGGCNSHEILAEGPAGRLRARIDNVPIHDSPRSSEQAALAIVRLLRCFASPLAV